MMKGMKSPRTKALSESDLASLSEAARRGDMSAFAALVRATQAYAYALAFRLLTDEQDALDAVQEAFVRVWRHLVDFDPKRKFTTWLYTIVSHVSLDILRSRKRRLAFLIPVKDSGLDDPADPIDIESVHSNSELAEAIRGLTDGLPPTQRLVFVLRDLQDCSIEEVVEITRLSAGSVKTNLHHARKRMVKILVNHRYVEE